MQQSDSNVWTSLVAQLGENLPAVQEIQVQSLSRESPCFFFPSPFKIIFKNCSIVDLVQFSCSVVSDSETPWTAAQLTMLC